MGENGNRHSRCQATPDTPVPSHPVPYHTDQIPPVVPPRGTPPPGPDFDLTPPEPEAPKAKRPRPRTVKTLLPSDWAPSTAHYQQAMSEGGKTAAWVEAEAKAMRDWAAARGERCVDWDARFRNWIRRGMDMAKTNGPRVQPVQPGSSWLEKVKPWEEDNA